MIGMFEHQYLKYKKQHLKNLVALAAADGNIHEDEVAFLYRIGKKYKLKLAQIKRILEQKDDVELETPEHHHQKVSLLFDMVGMMMADKVIEEEEMVFCKKMVRRFGYQDKLLNEMIAMYQPGVDEIDNWGSFVDESMAYQLKPQ